MSCYVSAYAPGCHQMRLLWTRLLSPESFSRFLMPQFTFLLKEEIELSALAQELTRLDKFSSQAWCAAGNCFSLQKEHENSIKFFNRAIQVGETDVLRKKL